MPLLAGVCASWQLIKTLVQAINRVTGVLVLLAAGRRCLRRDGAGGVRSGHAAGELDPAREFRRTSGLAALRGDRVSCAWITGRIVFPTATSRSSSLRCASVIFCPQERKGPRIAPRTLQLHPRHLPTWARQASAGPTGESNRRMSWIIRTWRFCSSAHSSASSRLVKGPTTGNSSPCGSRSAVRISAMSSTYPRIACPKSRHQPESLTGGLVGVVLAQSMTNRAETGRLLMACGLASGSLTPRRSIRRERIHQRLRRLR